MISIEWINFFCHKKKHQCMYLRSFPIWNEPFFSHTHTNTHLHAQIHGAGIAAVDKTSVYVCNSSFLQNSAGTGGGGIFLQVYSILLKYTETRGRICVLHCILVYSSPYRSLLLCAILVATPDVRPSGLPGLTTWRQAWRQADVRWREIWNFGASKENSNLEFEN